MVDLGAISNVKLTLWRIHHEKQTCKKKPKGRIGTASIDDFLETQGLLAEAEDAGLRHVLAWQIAEGMRAEGLTKTVMASRTKTGGRQLDRLLEPENKSVTMSTLRRRRWGGTCESR